MAGSIGWFGSYTVDENGDLRGDRVEGSTFPNWVGDVRTRKDILIVAHEVVNEGHDRTQLLPMGISAQQATGCKEITVLADRGYFNGDQVLACEDTGVLPSIPKTLTSSSAKRGLFTRRELFL